LVVKMVPLRPMAVPFSGVCLHPASRAVMTLGRISLCVVIREEG
jgi:hypothetical protein